MKIICIIKLVLRFYRLEVYTIIRMCLFFCNSEIVYLNIYYRIDISDSYIQKMKFRREYTPPNYNDESRAYGTYFGQGK